MAAFALERGSRVNFGGRDAADVKPVVADAAAPDDSAGRLFANDAAVIGLRSGIRTWGSRLAESGDQRWKWLLRRADFCHSRRCR